MVGGVATAGQPATFLCEATGAGFESATFAWFYEENMIIGDTATYTINAVQVTNAGVYTCVVRVGAVEKGRSNATLHVQSESFCLAQECYVRKYTYC